MAGAQAGQGNSRGNADQGDTVPNEVREVGLGTCGHHLIFVESLRPIRAEVQWPKNLYLCDAQLLYIISSA